MCIYIQTQPFDSKFTVNWRQPKQRKNPNTNYCLVIEEINRANVAAVFGDVFQLLDRDSNGESEYPVMTSKDAFDYLTNKNEEDKSDALALEQAKELKIPSNMYIWASMNSADQGVYPMDTAFKRRWTLVHLTYGTVDHGFLNRLQTFTAADDQFE